MSAFCGGQAVVSNVVLSNDIKATLNALKNIGADFVINKNNVTFSGFNLKNNAVIDCGECGSTFRFFIPICAMLGIKTQFIGSERLGERGYEDIITAMGSKVNFDKTSGLPLNINGNYDMDEITINGNMSSQFVSGIMLGAYASNKKITINLTGQLVSRGYVDMTIQTLKQFGCEVVEEKNSFAIIPKKIDGKQYDLMPEVDYSNLAFWEVGGVHLPIAQDNSKQGDKIVLEIVKKAEHGLAFDIDISNIPDLAPIFGVLLAKLKGTSTLKNCARLRIKECDRLKATAAELAKLGADIVEKDTSLSINGVENLRGAEVESHGDHRMAMTLAIASSRAIGEVKIIGAHSVSKSYPNFFDDFIRLGGRVVKA